MDQLRNFNYLALKCLLEICGILKEYPDLNKQPVYQKLSEFGLYEVLEEYLFEYTKGFEKLKAKMRKNKIKLQEDLPTKIIQMVFELLIYCLQHYPSYFRQHVVSEHQQVLKYPLLQLLVDQTFSNSDPIFQPLFLEVFKLLIEFSEDSNQCQDIFMGMFYGKIAAGISAQSSQVYKAQYLEITAEIIRHIKSSTREILIQTNLVSKVSFLLFEKDKFQQMKCLQLLKILLQSKDEELCNQFLDIFPALLQFLFHFRNRQQNLIYSQVLEIVRIIYSDFPKLQPPLEEALSKSEGHAQYQAISNIFKGLKLNTQKSTSQSGGHFTPTYGPQQHTPIDDEMVIFKSLSAHQMKGKQKCLVEYEEEFPIEKKVRIE